MVYYIGSIEKGENKGEVLKFYEKLEKKEYEKIDKAYCNLRRFTSMYHYYKMVEENREELYKVIKKAKLEQFSLNKYTSYENNIIYKINRLTINFVGIVYSYINNIEYAIKQEFGEESKHYEKLKEIINRYFEYNFEYRFIYKLRNYCIHHDLPINYINYTIGNKLNDLGIRSEILMRHPKEWKHLEVDFMNKENISIYDIVNNFQQILFNLNKEISLINKNEVVESMLLLARYIYVLLDNTVIIVAESEDDLDKIDKIQILNFSDITHHTEEILDELGILYSIK